MFLQEDALEGFELEANSFPTKEFAFELTSKNMEVEMLTLTSDEDERGVLVTMDEEPNQRSQTSTSSIVGL